MKMVALPKGKQYGINRACVNVPTRLDSMCGLLPRMPEEAQIIDLKLKRKLVFKGHHMHSTIDPSKIIKAVKWLKQNNPKYKDVDIMNNYEFLCQTNKLMNELSNKAAKDISFQVETQEDTENSGNNTENHLSEEKKQQQSEDQNIFQTD